MPNFYEALESRTFLSAAALTLGQPLLAVSPTLVQPLVTPVGIPGTYSGSINVIGIHTQPVTITLARKTATRFVGTLVPTADATIQVRVVVTKTGQTVGGKRFVTVVFKGTHGNGAINGRGTGVITPTGRLRVSNFVFIQGTQPFPGTVNVVRG